MSSEHLENGDTLTHTTQRKPKTRREWLTVQRVGVIFLTLAIVVGVAGYASQHPEGFTLQTLLADFYANISAELASIAITVLIIDALNRRRERVVEQARQRDQLMRQLGSSVNEVAKRAAEELRAHGWLTDGTLQESDLRVANLEGAKLWKADLQGVNLQWANLKYANLNGAVLVGANITQARLWGTKLGGADLRGANLAEAALYRAILHGTTLCEANLERVHLEGAKLENADLRGANLTGAMCDELTTLPDGTQWNADADLARFTDPAHPQAWTPPPAEEVPRPA